MSQGKIHFGSEVWTWTAGKCTVAIRDERRKKYAVPMTKVIGCDWEAIERARSKKAGGYEVTPARVREYIERELRKKA